MTEVRCVADVHAEVGEGPAWDDRRGVLWWVDIKAQQLFRFDPTSGEIRAWPMPERIGCVIPRQGGGLIGASKTGFKCGLPAIGGRC